MHLTVRYAAFIPIMDDPSTVTLASVGDHGALIVIANAFDGMFARCYPSGSRLLLQRIRDAHRAGATGADAVDAAVDAFFADHPPSEDAIDDVALSIAFAEKRGDHLEIGACGGERVRVIRRGLVLADLPPDRVLRIQSNTFLGRTLERHEREWTRTSIPVDPGDTVVFESFALANLDLHPRDVAAHRLTAPDPARPPPYLAAILATV